MDITLLTRDGVELRFPCAENEFVLGAAESAGYFLPAMCHEGTCGQCHARVAKGRYEMASHGVSPGSEPESVLLCRCSPQEPLTIELPCKDAQVLRQRVPVRQAAIASIEQAWEGAVALSLRLKPHAEFGSAAEFIPGQYMELTVPGTEIRRAYSLANLPNWDGELDFLIRLRPGGAFSRWLAERAKVGDELTVRGPLGSFVLDELSARTRCFVGGGCGAAPILSMLRHLGEFQDSQPSHFIFGANGESELVSGADIENLRAALPQLTVTLAVMHPGMDWCGFTGTAPAALEEYLAAAPQPVDIYTCGPPMMVDAIDAIAERSGQGHRVIAERVE